MSNTNFYTDKDLSTWQHIKKAMANDWEQTKADMGIDGNRDMNQDVDDTIKQAMGTEDAFENHEQAFRFGYTAQQKYHSDHPSWNDDLESDLRDRYDGDFDTDRAYIRHAYCYKAK